MYLSNFNFLYLDYQKYIIFLIGSWTTLYYIVFILYCIVLSYIISYYIVLSCIISSVLTHVTISSIVMYYCYAYDYLIITIITIITIIIIIIIDIIVIIITSLPSSILSGSGKRSRLLFCVCAWLRSCTVVLSIPNVESTPRFEPEDCTAPWARSCLVLLLLSLLLLLLLLYIYIYIYIFFYL